MINSIGSGRETGRASTPAITVVCSLLLLGGCVGQRIEGQLHDVPGDEHRVAVSRVRAEPGRPVGGRERHGVAGRLLVDGLVVDSTDLGQVLLCRVAVFHRTP